MSQTNQMTPIFSGESRHALDEKGRVTIPARWRRSQEGGDEFFLTVDRTGACLRAMPPEEFTAAVTRLSTQPGISPKDITQFERGFYAKSRAVTTDKQGRIIIPADYAASAGIKKEVVLVGVRSKFEIYQPEAWDRVQTAEADNFNRLSELAGL
jgi:MraZ protein